MSNPQFSSPGPESADQMPDAEVEVGSALKLRSDQGAIVPATLQAASVAAAAGAKAAIEARFHVAQLVRRDPVEVEKRVMDMCDDVLFADEALWSKPQGSTTIEGVSIRFAEEYVQEAGNFHVSSTVMWDDDEKRVIQVQVTDLERNNTIPVDAVVEKYVERSDTKGREVMGSRLNARGKRIYRVRATEDEVLMKQNSMVSKAFRTGVDRLIPRNLRAKAIERIKSTIRTAAQKDMPAALKKLLAVATALEIPQDHLEDFLGHRLQTTTVEEYEKLRVLLQSVKDGELTWDAVTKGARPKPQAQQSEKRPAAKVRSEGYESDQKTGGDSVSDEDRELDRKLVENEGRE